MCEGVGKDSRHGAWHVDIRIGMCIILLECVCVCHCIAHPVVGKNIFLGTGGTPGDEAHPRRHL